MDASDKAIGAELLQVQDGVEKVICYGSLSLTPSQQNYCTTRKELLAIVRFTREYHHYLLGRSFIVRTDHSSLTWLMHFKQAEGQLAQWLEELSQFDMAIQHQAGRKHQNADSLSRIPEEEYCNCYEAGIYLDDLPCGGCKYCTKMHVTWSRFEKDVDDVVPLAVRTVRILHDEDELVDEHSASEDSWLPQYPPEVLWEKQVQDPDLKTLIQWLENDENPSTQDLYLSSPAVKKFWLNCNLLVFKDKVLRYTWVDFPLSKQLLMVPQSLREEVLQGCHDCLTSGHLGQKNTYDRVRRGFMWHEMSLEKPRVKPKGELGSYHAG